MRTFSSFTFDVVEKMFNIEEVKKMPLLDEWIAASNKHIDPILLVLNDLKDHLLEKANIWNEDELKMFFIGPIVELAKIGNKDFQPFTQRSFSMMFQEEEIGGRVDFMIAKGRRVPETPYFCIHEYKQETDNSGDPLGQLLIAMVTAQYLNDRKHPVLGAYVLGRYWFFVVLDGQEYAKSMSFDATSEDIFQIMQILHQSNEIIKRYV